MDFEIELERLKTKGSFKKRSDPFIDEDDLLRVGGRIHKALVSSDKKHPIILSAKSHVAVLLCQYYHER